MLKFFASCDSIEQLKKQYRTLVKQNHPDCGGNEETIKEINAEYETLFKKIKGDNDKYHGLDDGFREIINRLSRLPNLDVEICGCFIWVTGDTYPLKDKLKKYGLFWARKKQAWYWKPAEYKSFNRRTYSMDEIRDRYGSEKVEKVQNARLA